MFWQGEAETTRSKRERVNAVPFWWHSIDFGDNVVAQGHKSERELDAEWRMMELPKLTEKSVLDIGAWDGWFSFKAESAGAREVLAMDYYTWSMDLMAMERYRAACAASGEKMIEYHLIDSIWKPDEMPGKRGFDLACELRCSRVNHVIADFMSVDLDSIGAYDFVFFLGVLYHLKNPFEALTRLAKVTQEAAIIETSALLMPGREDESLLEFYGENELSNDVSNWFAPNLTALIKMCLAAGFREIVPMNYSTKAAARYEKPLRYRLMVKALK